MLQLPAGRDASQEGGSVEYERHRPERTLFYQVIEEYYPSFQAQCAAEGKGLPDYERLQWVKSPTSDELAQLTPTIARRVGRFLECQGLIESDAENSHLALDSVDDDSMARLVGHSITYRIAMGPQTGRKVFTLQTLPACDPDESGHGGQDCRIQSACRFGGQSPGTGQAGTAAPLYHPTGRIRKTAFADHPRQGALRVEDTEPRWHHPCDLRPLDVIARLATLVPSPRVNLTRYDGVFAPNSAHRSQVTPAQRGKGNMHKAPAEEQQTTPAERHGAMSWAQRLKRVFNIDIETCRA